MFKRFTQNKRGVSTVIGVVFFVLVLLGGFSMIIWEITQYDAYMQVVNERNRLNWEKQNEMIEIVRVAVVNGKLSISVINKGAVTAHLVDLWITEYLDDTTVSWHRLLQIDYYLNPGNTTTNIGQELETPVLHPNLIYKVKILTERGNTAIATYSRSLPQPPPPPSVHAFGVFSLDWFYFRYTSNDHWNPIKAGIISKAEDYIAFYINVTNNYNETVTIKDTSMIMLLIDWQEPLFYIVKSVSYNPPKITRYNDADPITISPHASTILTFAASAHGATSWEWGDSNWPGWGGELPIGIKNGDTPEGAIVMTALVFTIGDSLQIQAQSLPFQALVLGGGT